MIINDVKRFFLGGGALEQLHGTFIDIGANKDFQKPEFFMPELLIYDIARSSVLATVSLGR